MILPPQKNLFYRCLLLELPQHTYGASYHLAFIGLLPLRCVRCGRLIYCSTIVVHQAEQQFSGSKHSKYLLFLKLHTFININSFFFCIAVLEALINFAHIEMKTFHTKIELVLVPEYLNSHGRSQRCTIGQTSCTAAYSRMRFIVSGMTSNLSNCINIKSISMCTNVYKK